MPVKSTIDESIINKSGVAVEEPSIKKKKKSKKEKKDVEADYSLNTTTDLDQSGVEKKEEI